MNERMIPLLDDEEQEPEWYRERYCPTFKPGDLVSIQVSPECEVHGKATLVAGENYYTKLRGIRAYVIANYPDDHTKKPYIAGHIIRVKPLQPYSVVYQGRTLMWDGGLFDPHELGPYLSKKDSEEECEILPQ